MQVKTANQKNIDNATQFRACSGTINGFGVTPADALQNLLTQTSNDIAAPIVIWPYNREDAYFTQAQQERLQSLKARLSTLASHERRELEQLIAAAFDATISRTQDVPRGLSL